MLVGASSHDNGELTDAGRASLYLGSASGLAASPAWTVGGVRPGAFFGHGVAGAGHVNGDRHADVIVGARAYTNDQTTEGRAFVYLGSDSGLAASADWTAEGDQEGAYFGDSVESECDENAKGYDNVIVAAPSAGNGQEHEGRAFVLLGSEAGLSRV